MKKRTIILLVMAYVLVLAGCTSQEEQTETESLVGYIVIEDNTLYLDRVEIVTIEDIDRIAELELNQNEDLPNGYYIYNPDIEKEEYELTDKTLYTFIDSDLLFINDKDSDRSYTTTKKEEFIQHLETSYSDEPPAQRVPFFIEVKDGEVISITEKLEFTI